MNRPERLVFFSSRPHDEDTILEALFVDSGEPILFTARLPFEEREFYADVFSTNEGSAEFFLKEELLDACFCTGSMKPENTEKTAEVDALIAQCVEPSTSNDLF